MVYETEWGLPSSDDDNVDDDDGDFSVSDVGVPL
jgi:hypothetical protein